MTLIETERLLLRTWKEEDLEPYYEMNQDPRVIEFLYGSIAMEEAKEFIADQNRSFLQHGYAFFAVEEKSSSAMIGFTGLMKAKKPLPTSAVEIGWRLSSSCWGRGYATEAAKAVLDYGFKKLGFEEICSCTVVENRRSQCIMEKIGMKRDLEGDFNDFEHPFPRHLLYRMKTISR